MPDRLMYAEEHYVVLAPDLTERFVTPAELAELLARLLDDLGDRLPPDLQKLSTSEERVKRLLATACDLDCGDAGTWQWYAVRLKKPRT